MPSSSTSRLPTVVDVARVAGVSRQTVSNVLNSPGIVAPATRARVETAISELNYRPHASARRLRTRKSSTIGVRLDPIQNGISGAVLDRYLHALAEQADQRDLRMLLFTAADPLDEIGHFRRLLDGADVDSFVLTSTSYDDPRTDWLLEHGVDFVSFGRPWGRDMSNPQHRWVDVDGHDGLAQATRALLAQGASRIAFLGWPTPSGTGDERRRGWRETMLEHGTLGSTELDLLDLVVEDSVALASASVQGLLDQGVLVDGIVCASDSLALGAFMVLAQSVPIIGFDDTPVAKALGLSSVRQPVTDVARATLELLCDPADAEWSGDVGSAEDPQHRLLAPSLILR